MPVSENGKVIGYQIMAIEPESIYEHLGIVDGDIITKVDGKAINSVESALQFFQGLKGMSQFNIDVKRDGSLRHYTYEVH
jgi:general secretion pathway protein C